jgi:glycerol-3-phosphate dehydrogenase
VVQDGSRDAAREVAKLTAKARKKIKPKNFALPKKKAYPIQDKSHARNALARVSQHGTPAQKKKVRAAVKKKYPSIKQTKGGKKK